MPGSCGTNGRLSWPVAGDESLASRTPRIASPHQPKTARFIHVAFVTSAPKRMCGISRGRMRIGRGSREYRPVSRIDPPVRALREGERNKGARAHRRRRRIAVPAPHAADAVGLSRMREIGEPGMLQFDAKPDATEAGPDNEEPRPRGVFPVHPAAVLWAPLALRKPSVSHDGMRTIRGRKALVTGAASGIGRALALALAHEGGGPVPARYRRREPGAGRRAGARPRRVSRHACLRSRRFGGSHRRGAGLQAEWGALNILVTMRASPTTARPIS